MDLAAAPPLFEAVIVPHRSLSRVGLRVLLGVICVLCLASATTFLLLGAWPVMGFTGIELGLAAFLLHRNAAAVRESELLLLSEAGLRVVRTDARGRRTEAVLPAAWLGVSLVERPGRVPALLLVGRGAQLEVAAALGEAEKRDLAAALSDVLHRWRHPSFDNAQLRDEAVSPPRDPST